MGYPTKNSLKAWHEVFRNSGDLQASYVRRKPKYSDEQKSFAIDHYINHGRCFTFTRKALGYPGRQTMMEWVYERHPEIKKCVVSKAAPPAASLASKRAAVYKLCTREGSGSVALWGTKRKFPCPITRQNHTEGRLAWQKAAGYGQRALVETTMGRYKSLIGPRVRARGFAAQQTEAAVGIAVLNHMLAASRTNSVRNQKMAA